MGTEGPHNGAMGTRGPALSISSESLSTGVGVLWRECDTLSHLRPPVRWSGIESRIAASRH
jgi:hypothetical protein